MYWLMNIADQLLGGVDPVVGLGGAGPAVLADRSGSAVCAGSSMTREPRPKPIPGLG